MKLKCRKAYKERVLVFNVICIPFMINNCFCLLIFKGVCLDSLKMFIFKKEKCLSPTSKKDEWLTVLKEIQ